MLKSLSLCNKVFSLSLSVVLVVALVCSFVVVVAILLFLWNRIPQSI